MRVLTISDSPNLSTGLARVHHNCLNGIIDFGHEPIICGWFSYNDSCLIDIENGNIPDPPKFKYKEKSYNIFSIKKRTKNAQEVTTLYEIIKHSNPDIVLTIGDYDDFYYMKALKTKCDYSFKWVFYPTIEREYINHKILPIFHYADYVIVPTFFGQKILSENGIRSKVIPYGVDECFSPVSEEKKKELKERFGCENKFRFITVAQNSVRKNIPATLQAINYIKNEIEDCEFYIHTNMDPVDAQIAMAFDLREMIKKFEIGHLVKFPSCLSLFNGISNDSLVEQYNASDCLISSSICEGFGLPILEAMACGLPVIANASSCMIEHLSAVGDNLYGKTRRGWLVKNIDYAIPPNEFVSIIDPYDLSSAILAAAKDKNLHLAKDATTSYAKGKTWNLMKNSIEDVFNGLEKNVSIPIEIL